MTPSEAFEARLARSDRSTLVGKLIIANGLTSTPTPLLILGFNTAGLGSRAVSMSELFARYKVNYVRVKFLGATTGTSPGIVAVGFQDDASGAEGDAPTTTAGLIELRCSATSFSNQTTPTELVFRPASRDWYYCQPGASGSDPRLAVTAILYASLTAAASPGTLNAEIDYSITFKGAVDVASS